MEAYGNRPELHQSSTSLVRVIQTMRQPLQDTVWWRWDFDLEYQVREEIPNIEAKLSPCGAFILLVEFEGIQADTFGSAPRKEFSKMSSPPGSAAGESAA